MVVREYSLWPRAMLKLTLTLVADEGIPDPSAKVAIGPITVVRFLTLSCNSCEYTSMVTACVADEQIPAAETGFA